MLQPYIHCRGESRLFNILLNIAFVVFAVLDVLPTVKIMLVNLDIRFNTQFVAKLVGLPIEYSTTTTY